MDFNGPGVAAEKPGARRLAPEGVVLALLHLAPMWRSGKVTVVPSHPCPNREILMICLRLSTPSPTGIAVRLSGSSPAVSGGLMKSTLLRFVIPPSTSLACFQLLKHDP